MSGAIDMVQAWLGNDPYLLKLGIAGVLFTQLFPFLTTLIGLTSRLEDTAYAFSFVAGALLTFYTGQLSSLPTSDASTFISTLLSASSPLHLAVNALVLAWGLRLGIFLYVRLVVSMKEGDWRTKTFKQSARGILFFWTLNMVAAFVVDLPVFALNSLRLPSALSVADYVILSMAAAGLLFEAVADQQKFAFKNDKANKNELCMVGLYRICRYPNYFGELLFWNSLGLLTLLHAPSLASALTALGPVGLIYLLLRVSGVPILEKSYEKRFGQNAEYKRYVAKTAKIIPFLY